MLEEVAGLGGITVATANPVFERGGGEAGADVDGTLLLASGAAGSGASNALVFIGTAIAPPV
jgi:hypothetical protein